MHANRVMASEVDSLMYRGRKLRRLDVWRVMVFFLAGSVGPYVLISERFEPMFADS